MTREIIFVLSSLNDPHFCKRVEEFRRHGYKCEVYGFLRDGRGEPNVDYEYNILGITRERNYLSRLLLYVKSMLRLSKRVKGKLCFYSSLDIAMFAKLFIKSDYIYEVCDLTELTIGNRYIRKFLSHMNELFILHSRKTIITSEGFASYFSNIPSRKFYLIPNKVSPEIPIYEHKKKVFNKEKIKIGFAGVIRFESIYHFVKVSAEYGKNIEIHLFGIYSDADEWSKKIKDITERYNNIIFHGRFSNPKDLPFIYDSINMVLCTYTPTLGVKYAEPNKLYEAIYFRCPIIVSDKVFLGDKVRMLNIGYVIDAMNEDSIKDFLENIAESDYYKMVKACEAISQSDCLNNNDDFFKEIENL